jgi:predicted permease
MKFKPEWEQRKVDLREELEAHLRMAVEERVARGESPQEARAAAVRELGNPPLISDVAREKWGWVWCERVMQDLRYAARQMRKNPGFAFTAVLVLTLGIGAAVTIYSFVDAALTRPLPYQDPSRLVIVYESNALGPHFHLSYLDYLDYRQRNTVFQSLEAYLADGFMMQTLTGPQPVHGARVTAGFFRTLGITPMLGRDFRTDDDQPAAPYVALISYGAWQRQFGGRADILGQTIVLDGNSTTIIGVLPREFHYAPAEPVDFWATERPDRGCEKSRGCHNLLGLARLKPGASLESARSAIETIANQIAQQYPGDDHDRGANLSALTEAILGNVRPILLALFSGAMLLLLISAINVSSLLLVRTERRRQEMAVRGALGASRLRLLRQFVTEGIVLAVSAGIIGTALAALAMHSLLSLIPKQTLASMPYLEQVGFNPRVLAFALLTSLAAGLLFSFLPALRISLAGLHAGLSEQSRGNSGLFWRRFGSNLVIAEFAITVVLLVGAGLLGKSLYRLLHVDLGFEPDHLATLGVSATSHAFDTAEKQVSFYRQLGARLSAIPGVRSVTFATELPIGDADGTTGFMIVGHAGPPGRNEVVERDVSASYFSTLRTRLARGRYFAENEDASHARVVLINSEMARVHFPGEDPIGKQIYMEGSPETKMEIIGIVDYIQEGQPDAAPRSAMYRPLYQNPENPHDGFSIALLTSQNPDAILSMADKTLHSFDPSLAVFDPGTMPERLHDSPVASLHRSTAFVVGGFAGLAFLLSSIGLYGVISYSVSQRAREIGVRMAMGAQRSTVSRMILREAAWLTVIGVLLGLAGALGAARLMGSLLFNVQTWDLPTLAAVVLALSVSALAASLLPARRAASVNPIDALRAE